ncbi:MAG: phosphatase PAP2 family protein [Candidatus Bathyarchaeia archaeon]
MGGAVAVLKEELPRKSVHLLAALIPPASILLGRTLIILGLVSAAALYAATEYLRVYKARRTFLSDGYSRLFRFYERAEKRMVVRPIFLALSVAACLLLFPEDIAYAAIMLVSLGDGLARIERLLLGSSPQGVKVGSGVASFGLGFVAASLFVDPVAAFFASVAAYLLEALPTRMDDNLTVPLGAALTLLFLQVTGLGSAFASALAALDISTYWWLAEVRSPPLYVLSLSLEYALPLAYAALGVAYTLRKGWRAGAHLGGALLAIVLITLATKSLVRRPRPCIYFRGEGVPSCPLTDYSFPSLHAAIAGTFLAYPVGLQRGAQVAWRLATVTFAVSVAVSRPYTGIHWVSDVAAGFLLSIILIFGMRRLYA